MIVDGRRSLVKLLVAYYERYAIMVSVEIQPEDISMTPIEIYDEIERVILEEPKRIYMDTYTVNPKNIDEADRPACNTVGCIAGWAVAIGKNKIGKLHRVKDIPDKAVKLLGIDYDMAHRLFHYYPDYEYVAVAGTKAYAKAVVKHMEEFRQGIPHLKHPAKSKAKGKKRGK